MRWWLLLIAAVLLAAWTHGAAMLLADQNAKLLTDASGDLFIR